MEKSLLMWGVFIADALNLAKIPPMLSFTITSIILAFGVLCSFMKEKTNNEARSWRR